MLNPAIELEQHLSQQIYAALHGELVEKILSQSSYNQGGESLRSAMEGHSFKVEKRLMGHLYDLLYGVKEKLGFKDDVDFYITGDSTVNAWTIAAAREGEPHIVNINSALVNLMSDDELRFVVGHELGHLMNKNTEMLRLIGFVFPRGTVPPLVLQYKIRLWEQLSELIADRFGYMAVESLPACLSAFFKMTSGLDINKIDMQVDAYLEENLKHLEYFINDKGLSRDTHPVNPIRVQSLNLYATCQNEEELEKKMEGIISALFKLSNDETDYFLGFFVATAGLIAINIDGEVTEKEIEAVLNNLSTFHIFPRSFLENVSKQNVSEIFFSSIQEVLKRDPGLREGMFNYIISLILSDSSFNEKELEFIFQVGADCFGFSQKEIADRMAVAIQKNFIPSYEAIC
ncbi:MAG: M48 family metalloprotease [Bacteroidales bacterium]|nr:M48 family metalloprotease [Bacteroidales bacterium]